MTHSGYCGIGVSEDDAINCVPDSLYRPTLLRIVFGGQDILAEGNSEQNENGIQQKVLSIVEDIVYGVSCGKKATPKHIALECRLLYIKPLSQNN